MKSIKFMGFSQRRRVGFRGAFEFDSKHIMIASESEIRILAYMPAIDAASVERRLDNLNTQTNRTQTTKSPYSLRRNTNLRSSEFGSP